MTKIMLVLATLLIAASTAGAATDTKASPELGKFSVQGGFGFFAEDKFDGFLLNMGAIYHLDSKISAGVDLQLGFDDDFLLLSMPFYGRYDFGDIPVDVQYVSDMHFFAKLGLGFTFAEFDRRRRKDVDDTGFLFLMGGGLSYPINDTLSVESIMQFNINTNKLFDDDFYFSWEMLSLRYRF